MRVPSFSRRTAECPSQVTERPRAPFCTGMPPADPGDGIVVFNGVANQYADNPIEVGVDETVRVFVLNAGPSIVG